MQIIEVKSNLVKASYNTAQEQLVLSGFIAIKDEMQSFIGQIINLEANSHGNFAIIKLLFNFNEEGVITNYNGSIPNLSNPIEPVESQELLDLLPVQNPILFGELAQQNTKLSLDRNVFENKLLICSEKEDDNEMLINNIAAQLVTSNKKLLIIDTIGNLDFSQNKVVASDNFKLPLNYETINFIYEKGLDNAAPETRALIQEVFLEVQEYVKTLPEQFIPFETFKNVVDSQYEEMDIIELLLLKNKLLKYYEAGIFAQEKVEFESLKNSLLKETPTILNLSKTDGDIQREMVSYAYSLIKNIDEEIYVIFNVDDSNADKKLLKQIFTTTKAYSTLVTNYSFKYLKELKQLSKNMIFFAPIQQQSDFAIYNVFLAKLNPHEFLIYGQATHHIPFIVKLAKLQPSGVESAQQMTEAYVEPEISQEEILDQEIKRDVDEIFTAPISQTVPIDFQTEESPITVNQDELTDEDLDFIDDLNIVDAEEETFIPTEEETNNDNSEWEATEIAEDEDLDEMIMEEEFVEETGNVEQEEAASVKEKIEYPVEEETEDEDEQIESFSNVLEQQAQEEFAPEEPPVVDIIPASMSSTPIVPIYSAEVEPQVQSDNLEQGDVIMHAKYGKGTVEKLISYGSKTLCSINFDNVGRRLLDPNLAELKKVD